MSTEQRIKEIKARRAQIKAALTRFTNFISDVMNVENIVEIKTRLGKIELFFNEFDTLQSELEFIDETELVTSTRNDLENQFYKVIAKAKGLIEEGSPPTPKKPKHDSPIIAIFGAKHG
ncbi:hypothetical protein NQ314_019718 [Rhamnusium bicolor]|uniref:Uncharacterized protein n=1 Tax=Rhamnusium bicolor TaxID=1586634 RepID=A0AAV8WMR5_9CUCU|nr:hypothetical protein NQ314_019718 [Rhamnusium bicolor]